MRERERERERESIHVHEHPLSLLQKSALHLLLVVSLSGVLIADLHHTRSFLVFVQYFRWVLTVPTVFDTMLYLWSLQIDVWFCA